MPGVFAVVVRGIICRQSAGSVYSARFEA